MQQHHIIGGLLIVVGAFELVFQLSSIGGFFDWLVGANKYVDIGVGIAMIAGGIYLYKGKLV